MPVISTAVGAVALAAASASVATVTAAVVAVSAAVGTLGLAVTAVGMATGNKGLLKAGKIMGYVGLAGGIAGYAVGAADVGFAGMNEALGAAYKEGAGIMSDVLGLSPSGAVTPLGTPGTEQIGSKAVDTSAGALNEMAAVPSTAASSNAPPSGLLDTVGKSSDLDAAGNVISPSPWVADPYSGQAPAALQSVPADQTALAAQTKAAAIPVGDQGALASQTQAAAIPATPSPGGSVVPPPINLEQQAANTALAGHTVGSALSSEAAASAPSFLAGIPDYAKYGLLTASGQGLAGALAGYFPGLSAEEQNRRLWEVQRWQQANAAHAPYRSFVQQPVAPAGRTGLINAGRT